MTSEHPFVQRIRVEREVITLVNSYQTYFGCELAGLGRKAIAYWVKRASKKAGPNTLGKLHDHLIGFSQNIRAIGGHSHRGAMIATSPPLDLTEQYLSAIRTELDSLTALR